MGMFNDKDGKFKRLEKIIFSNSLVSFVLFWNIPMWPPVVELCMEQ